ncbi:hypothetical protein KAI46_08605 [bacterium]|nr:hypothetical protein [bacterium]
MKWAVEIQNTSLERRNLADLLSGLGFSVMVDIDSIALTSSSFDSLETYKDVWAEAKKLRQAITGPANIDSDFTLGAVIDYTSIEPKRHFFLEVESGQFTISGGHAILTVSPPVGLSEEKLEAWKAARIEQEYQAKLESQRSRLEPAFLETRAAKMLDLLQRKQHNGESLYKIYELVEGHPSKRKQFQIQFEISKNEFDRFADAVHNPVVSGDLARHAYNNQPRTKNPMTIYSAEGFVVQLAERWLASVRLKGQPKPSD